MGILLILLISKRIGRIRFISYIGRYSLIVLCTHLIFVRIFYHIFHNVFNSVSILFFIMLNIYVIFFLFDYSLFFKLFAIICSSKGFSMCKTKIIIKAWSIALIVTSTERQPYLSAHYPPQIGTKIL